MMNKKAALTTRQIVILIILITSFVIILFLILRLNLQETTDKQICHNSVIQRGSSLLSLTNIIPLNCKTYDICISATSSCNNKAMPTPDDTVTVRSEEEVLEVLTKEMAECWWMYGEGEIDYLGERDWGEEFYCSLCTHFVFDDSVQKIIPDGKIRELDLFNYMITHEHSPGLSYYEYIKGQRLENEIGSGIGDVDGEKVTLREFDISKTNNYILMAIASKQHPLISIIAGSVLVTAAAAITVASVGTLTPLAIGLVAGGGILIGGGGGYIIGTYVEGGSGNNFITPTIVELDSDDYKGINCADVKTLS